MTTLTDNLGTQYFQLSTVGVGALAVGLEDIKQCINIILTTIPGTDPFRPLFGCNAYLYTDKPINIAIPNIKKEIFDALSLWEPRIEVVSIIHSFIEDAQLEFAITYNVIDDDVLDTVVYSGGAVSSSTGSSLGSIIISAAIPSPIPNGVYRSLFTVDGNNVIPAIPSSGFQNTSDLLTWIIANWSNYGRWYLTQGTLVLYLNSGIATKVFLSVTESAQITLKVLIPQIDASGYLNLNFQPNGEASGPAYPANTINTVEGLLTWLLNNWGNYGNWSITTESINSNVSGDFSSDFSTDFSISDGLTVNRYLIFQSDALTNAILNFN